MKIFSARAGLVWQKPDTTQPASSVGLADAFKSIGEEFPWGENIAAADRLFNGDDEDVSNGGDEPKPAKKSGPAPDVKPAKTEAKVEPDAKDDVSNDDGADESTQDDVDLSKLPRRERERVERERRIAALEKENEELKTAKEQKAEADQKAAEAEAEAARIRAEQEQAHQEAIQAQQARREVISKRLGTKEEYDKLETEVTQLAMLGDNLNAQQATRLAEAKARQVEITETSTLFNSLWEESDHAYRLMVTNAASAAAKLPGVDPNVVLTTGDWGAIFKHFHEAGTKSQRERSKDEIDRLKAENASLTAQLASRGRSAQPANGHRPGVASSGTPEFDINRKWEDNFDAAFGQSLETSRR